MKLVYLVLLCLASLSLNAQELFPLNFPASTLPKGALGIRVYDESYKEESIIRDITALKLMYGLLSNLTVTGTATFTNYHQNTLPFDFVNHNHSGKGAEFTANNPQLGIPYPFTFDGVDLYAQYRFLKIDGPNSHFRMAVDVEGSYIILPSHETEPFLVDHTSGFGGGVIATYLKNHFAVSLNTGFILPVEYIGNATDTLGGVYPTKLQYGNAVFYNLSFGYLLFPRHYKNYNQTNWNVYMEFIGKSYGAAIASQTDGTFPGAASYNIPATTTGLKTNSYVEVYPGIQCIVKSNLRIDLSAGFPLYSQSYLHEYPLIILGIQQYFFFNKKSTKTGAN